MIVTARARWIVLGALASTLFGLLTQSWLVAQIGLTAILWAGIQWAVFRYRVDVALRGAVTERVVRDRAGPVRTLWERRNVYVRTRIKIPTGIGLTYAQFSERIPVGAEVVEGDHHRHVALGLPHETVIEFVLRPHCIGVMQMEGIRVHLSDLSGLFYAYRFLPMRQKYRVLPPMIEAAKPMTMKKRVNQLPPPGRHRHLRPGTGSELLEIRDYVPGDPPRSIAWKVSARRDCLMSKQFESEVPVRCTLLVDASRSTRLGYPGPTPLGAFARLAASIVETMIASRDPVGLSLFDADGVDIVRPAANRQTAIRILTMLADACAKPIQPFDVSSREFVPRAIDLIRELDPQSLDRAIEGQRRFLSWMQRATTRQRKQVAAVLAVHYELGCGALTELTQNDRALSFHLQRFLAEHQISYRGPMAADQGSALFVDAEKIQRAADLLTRAIGQGRDNELFVLMADLLDFEDTIAPLLSAVQVATARHHRVVVVCAWPPGMPPPTKRSSQVLDRLSGAARGEIVLAADHQRRDSAFFGLRRRLARLKIPVVCVEESTVKHQILSQIEALRGGRVSL